MTDLQQVIKGIIHYMAVFEVRSFFENKSMEERIPFIVRYLYSEGIYMMPVGASWCSPMSKKSVEEYLKRNEQLFKDYDTWYWNNK